MLLLSQDRLQHVLDEIDPVDLSHVMWAVARLDSYPAPELLDALLATLPPQINSAEPTVCLPCYCVFCLWIACGHSDCIILMPVLNLSLHLRIIRASIASTYCLCCMVSDVSITVHYVHV